MCQTCLLIRTYCYFDYRINKPLTCCRCLVYVSCSVHAILTYYVRKGSLAFFFILITHKATRSEIRITCKIYYWRTTRAKDRGLFILIEVRKSYDMHNILPFKVVHSSSPLLLLEPSVKSFYPAKCKPWVSSMSFLTLCSSCERQNCSVHLFDVLGLWMVTVGLKVRIVPFRVMRQIKIHDFCY